MKIVWATEYAIVLYREKLPKFRNIWADWKWHMVFNRFQRERDWKNIPKIHPTQKPTALLEWLIKTYTNEGDTVLDNCMGSGSTGVACVNTNRNFIGIELDDNYFKIAEDRINKAKESIFEL